MFENEFRVTKDTIGYNCFQNTDSNKKHIYRFPLFFSKARIALLDEIFTSRSVLIAFQLITRFLAKNIKVYSEDLINVHILGDSTCVINSISQAATFFKLYIFSKLSDMHLTIDYIRKQAKAMPKHHILSKENITGLAARSETSLSMLGPNSIYQIGPHYLSLP